MQIHFKKISAVLFLFIFAAFTVFALYPEDSEARRRSSGFKFSKTYKSSSSWKKSGSPSKNVWGKRSGGGIFGYKKQGAQSGSKGFKTKKTQGSQKVSGYSKPYNKTGKKSGFKSTSKFDRKTARAMKKKKAASSLAAYKAEKNKFRKTAEPVTNANTYKKSPVFKKAKTYSSYDYRTQYNQRKSYYNQYNWRQPGYVFASQPRFGMWDALVWWMILDNLGSRNHYAMAYHHSNDQGYQEWRKEADRLAKDNEELGQKLKTLDNKVAIMEGVPKDNDYLPVGMPAEVAIAADVLASKKPENPQLILATASTTGNYHKFGKFLKLNSEGELNVKLRTTAGSLENLRLLVNGEVDAAILQSDVFTVYKKKYPNSKLSATEQVPLYTEAVQMVANTKSDIYSVKDISPGGKHILYIGPQGSGTSMTWLGFCGQDSSYKKIQVRYAPYETALENVIQNKNSVMMFVSGLNSRLLKMAEQEARENKTIRLIEVNDWNFNNASDSFGNNIYRFVDIPSKIYPALQKGFISSRDIETIAVEAVLVVRTEWAQNYGPESMDSLSFAVMETRPVIANLTNGLER